MLPKTYTKTGWINIYRSGHFHRAGKPDTYDRHPGDIYESFEEAIKTIEPAEHYIATVPVQWQDPEDIEPNPANSIPVPLSVSRRNFRRQRDESVRGIDEVM